MLQLQDIDKSYDGQPLLRGLSFEIARRETVCLLGPSGSGKSTVLQLVAGLDSPEAGRVLWEGEDLVSMPPHRRDFGLVFQDYALFPHLDVFNNIAFGLKMKSASRAETSRRVAEVLRLVDLAGFERRSVANLSGGEQQRVALARALAPRPRLLMLDEPLAALDRALREELLGELRGILARTRIPALYVTHDQEEAFKIADRILLLHQGRIVQAGSPADVWARPVSAWVAGFLGLGNILSGEIVDKGPRVRTGHGLFPLHCQHKHKIGDTVRLLARPARARGGALLGGTVHDVVFQQDRYRATLSNGLFFDAVRPPRVGSKVTFRLRLECLGADQPA
jgi:ABC-type Fe3+/spermidine/putrescine transport system ATPase subunit